MMRSILLFALLTGAASADTIGFVYANGSFTNITGVPGLTAANGINDAGQIVGDAIGGSFILSGGVYTQLVFPGATFTSARSINNAGQVVGTYSYPGEPIVHGFLYTNGAFVTLDDPWAGAYGSTYPWGINDAGEIVGSSRMYPSSNGHGFLYNAGTFTDLNQLGFAGIWFTDINNAGQLIGNSYSSCVTHGDLFNGARCWPLNFYLIPSGTEVFGINDTGVVIGFVGPGNGIRFELSTVPNFEEIFYPQASGGTYLWGINNAGQIVGTAYGVPPGPEVSTGWLAPPVLIGIVAWRLTLRRIQ
jgi:probable HAF family extracellular repeat protein